MYLHAHKPIWKMLLAEFVGTFFLVTIGAGAVALSATQGKSLVSVSLAFGFILTAIVYTFGSYSGAHVNPSVSFGMAVAGRMNWLLMLGYWIAQIVGGIAAAGLVLYFFGNSGPSIGSLTDTDGFKAFLLEAFITFFLVFTVLVVTRRPMLAVISGLAIGLVLAADMFAAYPLTGASTNFARSFGSAIFSGDLGTIWIYVAGPLAGALVAGLIYKLMECDWRCKVLRDECGEKVQNECCKDILCCERPVLDNCGKKVKDECGNLLTEKFYSVKEDDHHFQHTWASDAYSFLNAHGANPQHLMKGMESKGCCGNEFGGLNAKYARHNSGDHKMCDEDMCGYKNHHTKDGVISKTLQLPGKVIEDTGKVVKNTGKAIAKPLPKFK